MSAADADAGSAAAAPARSIEIELKFDVDAGVPLPDWSGLPGVASVSAGEARSLDAMYIDTDDAALARAGYALRRRTGGPDAGWHIKGPRRTDGGRIELHWPLGGAEAVPDGARAELAPVVGDAALVPLARIRNERVAYLLLSESGEVVAEFADDHVRTTDERAGIEREWQEWEIELGPAGPTDPAARAAFFAAVEKAATAAGARAAASDSKLARALGH
ncbi:CYTH domain-containing protein [Microbacterium sulfonylureivorans]|uniref:CYTH domain-containing protein n=1 Tax=Microbacterium sulfonylureivorans TaxID=2486854 RepID=UPI000FD6BBC8|nr:CYTH domain-containing protein [Microbacterium sulfonylureivorans]